MSGAQVNPGQYNYFYLPKNLYLKNGEVEFLSHWCTRFIGDSFPLLTLPLPVNQINQ